MSAAPVTLVVTSCGRVDLLVRTLESLEAIEPGRFARRVIVEDSGDEAVAAEIRARFPDFDLLFNQPNIGQMRAIDRAYATVETEYVFHCEDDWLFEGPPFLDTCLAVLRRHPEVSVACVRRVADLPPRYAGRLALPEPDAGYALMPPDAHPEWFGYSFNPGLARSATYRRYGPYAAHVSEEVLSYRLKRDGYVVAYLEPGAASHIGGDRHVLDPARPARAKTPFSKLRRSVDKRLTRLRRALERAGGVG